MWFHCVLVKTPDARLFFSLSLQYNIGKVAWVNLFNKDNLQAYRLFKDLVAVIVKNFVPDLRDKCKHAVNESHLLGACYGRLLQ